MVLSIYLIQDYFRKKKYIYIYRKKYIKSWKRPLCKYWQGNNPFSVTKRGLKGHVSWDILSGLLSAFPILHYVPLLACLKRQVSKSRTHWTITQTLILKPCKVNAAKPKMFNPEEQLFFTSLVWLKCLGFTQLFRSIK